MSRKSRSDLKKENASMREALAFYAGWGIDGPKHDDAVHEDSGDKARAVLAAYPAGFFAGLTDEQQQEALNYRGPENIGQAPAVPEDVAGLVTRLKIAHNKRDGFDAVYLSPEAADALTTLSTRLAQVERERDKANARAESQWAGWIKADCARKDAETERDRLREACNQARLAFAGMVSVQSAIDKLDRAALSEGGKTDE